MFYQSEHFGSNDYFLKETGTDFFFPVHIHLSFEFVTMLSGTMEMTVDDRTYRVRPGEGILVFPHQRHSMRCSGEHILCIFAPDMVTSFSAKVAGVVPESNKFKIDKYLVEILKNTDNDADITEKKGLLYLICAGFFKKAEFSKNTFKSSDILYNVFRFIEDNYRGNCTLEDAAKAMGISYSYLSRYFKKTVGMSYNSYVNQYRIGKASYLLDNTDMTVLECAYEAGFSSLRSFNRNFKLYKNIKPSDLKKQSYSK